MALGDNVLLIHKVEPMQGSGNSAQESTYASHANFSLAAQTFTFDAATEERIWIQGVISSRYTGGGINLTFAVMNVSATSSNYRFDAEIFRISDGSLDLEGAGSLSWPVGVTVAVPTGSTKTVKYATISFSSSQVDGILKNELFALILRRNPAHADDAAAGDAAVVTPWIFGIETA